MRVLVALILAVIFILLVVFSLQNMEQQVTVRLLRWHSPPAALSWVVLLSILAGVAFTGLVSLIESIKLRVRSLQLSRRIRRLEAEVAALRNEALEPLVAPPPPPEPPVSGPPYPAA